MKTELYLLRDNKACVYAGPFKAVNREVFLRELATLKNADNMYAKHPEDFGIYYAGKFDDSNGTFETVPPEHITNLIDVFGVQ